MVMILKPLADFLDFSLEFDENFGQNVDYVGFDYDGQLMLMVVVVKSILVVPL